MKKISLLCALLTIVLMLALPNIAQAAGEEEVYFYDYEDYTAAEGSNALPDDNYWRDDATSLYWSLDSYGSKDLSGSENPEDAKHGRVFAIHRGQASMYFEKPLTEGKLHISFDAKTNNPDHSLMFHSYTNDKGAPYSDGYAKYFFLNGYEQNQLSYYTGLTNWEYRHFDASVSTLGWHHYDIVMTGITEADARVKEYVDGRLVHDGHRPSATGGFLTFSIRAGARGGVAIDTLPADTLAYVDNLMIRRYHNDTALALISANAESLPTDNAVVNVKLSERVNKTLTAADIKVSGPWGEPDYSITELDETGFTVKFNKTLDYGKYSITLNESVKGEISKASVKYPLVLKTSDRYTEVVTDYIKESFDGYSGNGVLPDGFVTTEGSTDNEYAQRTTGSGGDKDGAFGLCGFTGASRKITSMFSRLMMNVPADKEYEVSFDIKADKMNWYLYLPESGDIENADTENAVIGADHNGNLKYAKDRASNTTAVIGDGIALEPEQWHSIKLKVVPDAVNGETKYKLRVDNGEEYTLETSRRFHLNQTEGIGFGYREIESGAELHIDNLKVMGAQNVKFPEVEGITLYDCNGNEVSPSTMTTTKISEARIKYNTLIAEDYKDFICVYKEGDKTEYESELITNDDATHTVVIYFRNMLEPMTTYKLAADTGLASAITDKAVTYMKEQISLTTINDIDYAINELTYDAEKSEAAVEFIKNNSDEGKYIFAVCAYKEAEVNVDGEIKMLKRLSNIELIPIEITSDMMGIIRYTLPIATDGDECEVVPYLWNYPGLDSAVK